MWDSVQIMQGQIHLYHSFEILLAVTFSEIEWLNANYRFWLLLSVRRHLQQSTCCCCLTAPPPSRPGGWRATPPLSPPPCAVQQGRDGFLSMIRY